MFVYLAHPIDQAGESSYLGSLVETIKRKLAHVGVGAFLPGSAFMAKTTDPLHAEFIDAINNTALCRADALVAVLVAGIPTLGTPVEVSAALALGKPTVVFTDIIGSVQLAAWANSGATIIDLNDPDLDPAIPEASDLRAMLLFAPDVLLGADPEGMNPMYVKYAPGARPLTKANPTDAGFDIATLEETLVHSGVKTMLRTGVQASVPDGWWGQITARSSTMIRWNLRVHDAVIDAGYTGELLLGVTYCGIGSVVVPAQTRLAQYILHPVWGGEIEVVDVLPEHIRGENGYGSSGL